VTKTVIAIRGVPPMPLSWQKLYGSLATALIAMALVTGAAAQGPIAIDSRFADVNGTRLHYLVAGKGDPILLLHGYAQNSHMWRPLMAELAKTHTVIAPDLRGFGQSAKPDSGYDKPTMAKDVHALAASLGYKRVGVVGHDIGLMVAYAYAAQYPAEVDRIVLMDAFLPGVGDWTTVWLLRDLWHFHFCGKTPLALVNGRERIYLEHFWNDFAADPVRSVSEVDRQFYTTAYAQPGAMQAGFEVFRAFEQDAKHFASFARTKLKMPMLVLTGEKASGEFLIAQGRLVAENVEGVVIKGSGHWLVDEAPDQVIPTLVTFFTR
jgi:pimeloyl-ACP methyl ester carboxylesterase